MTNSLNDQFLQPLHRPHLPGILSIPSTASHSVIPFFLSLISNWVSFHHFYFLPFLFFWLGLGLGLVFGFPGIYLLIIMSINPSPYFHIPHLCTLILLSIFMCIEAQLGSYDCSCPFSFVFFLSSVHKMKLKILVI